MSGSLAFAQQLAATGTFVLHTFAQPIGKETYNIVAADGTYTLSSHFFFTDRSTTVPLETTFTAHTADMQRVRYAAKGKSSRLSPMNDTITFTDPVFRVNVNGQKTTLTPAGAWFVADGYSPVAMREQMMRWWLLYEKPAPFTVNTSGAMVGPRPLLELWRITLDPAEQAGWIHFHGARLHHLCQIPVADPILAVSADTQQDDLDRERPLGMSHPSASVLWLSDTSTEPKDASRVPEANLLESLLYLIYSFFQPFSLDRIDHL